jgi:hypothetical protein
VLRRPRACGSLAGCRLDREQEPDVKVTELATRANFSAEDICR